MLSIVDAASAMCSLKLSKVYVLVDVVQVKISPLLLHGLQCSLELLNSWQFNYTLGERIPVSDGPREENNVLVDVKVEESLMKR